MTDVGRQKKRKERKTGTLACRVVAFLMIMPFLHLLHSMSQNYRENLWDQILSQIENECFREIFITVYNAIPIFGTSISNEIIIQ